MAYIFIRCSLRPELAPKHETQISRKNILLKLLSLWPFIGLITAIMGSIAFGIATPTEAGTEFSYNFSRFFGDN